MNMPEKKPVDVKLVWAIVAFLIVQTFAMIGQFYELKTRVAVNEARYESMVTTIADIKTKVDKVYELLMKHD
jgi:hypothetical protein